MMRRLVILALLVSAAIHAALTPEHLAEMPKLGIGFAVGAAGAVAVAAWLALDHRSSHAFVAASVLFSGMLAAWALAVTTGIPFLMKGREPVELAAVICKLVEAAGLLAAVSPPWRRGLVLAVPSLLLLAVPGPLPAADEVTRTVTIPGKLFEPERLDLLVGDTVTWTNGDAVRHTVTADDGSFDSGDLESDATFSMTFTKAGRTTYHCAIHRFMTGEIEVFALALSGPLDPVRLGAQFSLRGLAQPGTDLVTLERRDVDGAFVSETTATPSGDGRFSVTVPAVVSTDYRAVAGALTSPVVHVGVSPQIALHVQRTGRRVRLAGSAFPPQPGMPGALEIYSRERFAWRRFARVRFDASSRVHVTLSPRRELYLRLVLLHATPGFVGGASNGLSVVPRPSRP
jgi:plastocyanin